MLYNQYSEGFQLNPCKTNFHIFTRSELDKISVPMFEEPKLQLLKNKNSISINWTELQRKLLYKDYKNIYNSSDKRALYDCKTHLKMASHYLCLSQEIHQMKVIMFLTEWSIGITRKPEGNNPAMHVS